MTGGRVPNIETLCVSVCVYVCVSVCVFARERESVFLHVTFRHNKANTSVLGNSHKGQRLRQSRSLTQGGLLNVTQKGYTPYQSERKKQSIWSDRNTRLGVERSSSIQRLNGK